LAKAHNRIVRLLHRNHAAPSGSLEEGDCYERSYGESVLGHVDVVHLKPREPSSQIAWDLDPGHHVTSEGLKRQFAERLAARRRRR